MLLCLPAKATSEVAFAGPWFRLPASQVPVLACSAATHRAIVCVGARQRYRPRQATSDKPKRAQAAAGCLSSSGRFSHRPLRPQVSLPASLLSASPISSASPNGACAHILSSVFAAASVQRAAAGRFAGCKRPCGTGQHWR